MFPGENSQGDGGGTKRHEDVTSRATNRYKRGKNAIDSDLQLGPNSEDADTIIRLAMRDSVRPRIVPRTLRANYRRTELLHTICIGRIDQP